MIKKPLTFFILRQMKPSSSGARRAITHSAATTSVKALATTISSSIPSSTSAAPATTPRLLWWLSAQRRKMWLHDKSCRTMSTMISTDQYKGVYDPRNTVTCPPWQVGCFLKDRTPSEEDWWCRPESIFATTRLADENCDDVFLSNNASSDPDVVVKSQSQVVWVMDDEDEERMVTKETLTVTSSFVETANSHNHHHNHINHNYENIVNGTTETSNTMPLDRLFRNYGNENWHKARAAWRCTSSQEAFNTVASTSCWPTRAPASTRPLEGREMNRLVQQFQQQATDAIGEYDLPRRIRLQDVVSIYSNIWKETEPEEEEAEVVVDWND